MSIKPLLLASLMGALGVLLIVAAALADDPHSHGVDVPDWYDPNCCNLQDCRPVLDEDIDFKVNEFGQPVVFHKPTGIEFAKDKWRPSQDERYHVCYRGNFPNFTAFCVYLRGGA